MSGLALAMSRFAALLAVVVVAGCGDDGEVVKPPADRAPVVTGPATTTVAAGEPVAVTYVVTDPDGDRVTGASVEPATSYSYGGTPFTIVVDWIACAKDTFTVKVTAISGDPPIEGSMTTTVFVTGQPPNYYIDVVDGGPQADTLTISDEETVAWRNLSSSAHDIHEDDYSFRAAWLKPGCETRAATPRSGIYGPVAHDYVCGQHPGEHWVVLTRQQGTVTTP